MQIEIYKVNAFTKGGKGGNPAAVVLNADELLPVQKQEIAKSTGLSETAFVGNSGVADFKLEFFTPVRQIAHCGHATIATFAYLKQTGHVPSEIIGSSKETIDGTRRIRYRGNEVFMEQKAPIFTAVDSSDVQAVFTSLGLEGNSHQPTLVWTGNRFLILEVESSAELKALAPDMGLIAQISSKYDLIGYYIFSRDVEADATARMFAPAYGIPEESATGMAAGPLAAYLYEYHEKKSQYFIEQGNFMSPAMPSLITVELAIEKGSIVSLFAGGSATLVERYTLSI